MQDREVVGDIPFNQRMIISHVNSREPDTKDSFSSGSMLVQIVIW